MLKTNSKKARENIRAYIIGYYIPDNYDLAPATDFPTIAGNILQTFREEMPAVGTFSRMSEGDRFMEWASGLPSILNCCYYYNRSAVDDLGAILEETEEEKARFTESQAEALLTSLIYRELMKA